MLSILYFIYFISGSYTFLTPFTLFTHQPPRRTLNLYLEFLDLYFNQLCHSELLWALVSSFVNRENCIR